ncbi:MAG: hypothetical protein P8R39_03990, partial [Alphaproteobacteria bacterium]|nr:hypothetical protein [Alphaproteobacteria bacterium]
EIDHNVYGESINENPTDRSGVTLDMVAPALKKLYKGYKEKADEYHTAYAEMEADGMSDEEIMNAGDDIIDYVKIDDIEDKIAASRQKLEPMRRLAVDVRKGLLTDEKQATYKDQLSALANEIKAFSAFLRSSVTEQ